MKGNSSCIRTRLPGCGLCVLLAVSLSSLVVVLGRDVSDHVCDVVREECREL